MHSITLFVVIGFTAVVLAGCATDSTSNVASLSPFRAVYEDEEGNERVVRLEGPSPSRALDGSMFNAWNLQIWNGPDDGTATWMFTLDSTGSVVTVRQDCLLGRTNPCDYHAVSSKQFGYPPLMGIGLPGWASLPRTATGFFVEEKEAGRFFVRHPVETDAAFALVAQPGEFRFMPANMLVPAVIQTDTGDTWRLAQFAVAGSPGIEADLHPAPSPAMRAHTEPYFAGSTKEILGSRPPVNALDALRSGYADIRQEIDASCVAAFAIYPHEWERFPSDERLPELIVDDGEPFEVWIPREGKDRVVAFAVRNDTVADESVTIQGDNNSSIEWRCNSGDEQPAYDLADFEREITPVAKTWGTIGAFLIVMEPGLSQTEGNQLHRVIVSPKGGGDSGGPVYYVGVDAGTGWIVSAVTPDKHFLDSWHAIHVDPSTS